MTTRPPGNAIRAMIQALLNFCRAQKPTPPLIRLITKAEELMRDAQKVE